MGDDCAEREAELREAFKADPEFGLRWLDNNFREDIFRYIKSVARALDIHAVRDVYQQTMLELLPKVWDVNFNWDKPMAIVLRIARTNAIDAANRKGFRAKQCDESELKHFAVDFFGTRIGQNWKGLDPIVRQEFNNAIEEIVDKLPPKQKVVVVCFRDLYTELRERDKWAPLADAVSQVTGKPESVSSVKTAWHEAKTKIAEQLKRRGFDFVELDYE